MTSNYLRSTCVTVSVRLRARVYVQIPFSILVCDASK